MGTCCHMKPRAGIIGGGVVGGGKGGSATALAGTASSLLGWPQRQSWSQRKGGWNKYKREDSQSSKPGDDSWRNIKEASREEVRAAEERRAQAKEAEVDDDGDYLRALWQSARDEAQADPNRPPSAAELVKKGTLQPWWTMSWGDIRVKFPDVGEYESFLLEAAPGTPKPVVGRLATVLAALRLSSISTGPWKVRALLQAGWGLN